MYSQVSINNSAGVAVFAAIFNVNPPVGFRGYGGKMMLCWDVYTTSFRRLRTTCYGRFVPDVIKEDCYTTTARGIRYWISGIALLHRDHPEDFDIKTGIYKSFSRAVHSLVNEFSLQFFFGKAEAKANRKNIWDEFEKVFKRDFFVTLEHPYGAWFPHWHDDQTVIYNDAVALMLNQESHSFWDDTYTVSTSV